MFCGITVYYASQPDFLIVSKDCMSYLCMAMQDHDSKKYYKYPKVNYCNNIGYVMHIYIQRKCAV